MDLRIDEVNETGELTTTYVQTSSNGNQRIDVIVSPVLGVRGELRTTNEVLLNPWLTLLILSIEVPRENSKPMVSIAWSLPTSWLPTQRDERLHQVRGILMQ